jgi:hypothetical protein
MNVITLKALDGLLNWETALEIGTVILLAGTKQGEILLLPGS